MLRLLTFLCAMLLPGFFIASPPATAVEESLGATDAQPLYIFTVPKDGTPRAYDETLAAVCLQGLINRDGPSVYLLSAGYERPAFWLDIFTKEGRWLEGRPQKTVATLDELRELAGGRVNGAVIWDPTVPATVNVATTIAGVEDCVALSPELADDVLQEWDLPVLKDLRGMFDGSQTGSAKNDAYRWAIDEYLETGRCNPHYLHLYMDAWDHQVPRNISTGYVVNRDWSVYQRAFVFDLSPWADETPMDDPGQELGLDKSTYEMILAQTMKNAAGEQMTELTGFFSFQKYSNYIRPESKHEPVPTEWETVKLITPYNAYQNTAVELTFNQSLHSQFPFKPLKQTRPEPTKKLENKSYICLFMADYDSAYPLYDFLPGNMDDAPGEPLHMLWGFNPNLIECYPDVISYYYETASPYDHFAADASAAGYMNPNSVPEASMPLFVRHNKRFYDLCDMTISPMVLDWDQPTTAVKDAFAQFSPDGYASILDDFHNPGKAAPIKSEVWKGMPITELVSAFHTFPGADVGADIMNQIIVDRGNKVPGFHLYRIIWTKRSEVAIVVDRLKEKYPDRNYEFVDPYTFFRLYKESMAVGTAAK